MLFGSPSALRRASFVIVFACAVVSGACAGRGVFKPEYEYEEELYLALDGSATLNVNASVASLVALRGFTLDPNPRARLDRAAVRAPARRDDYRRERRRRRLDVHADAAARAAGASAGAAPRDPDHWHNAGSTAATIERGSDQKMTGKTVLLVEDNPHNRKIFSGMLVHAGFAVVEAEDGHQALEAVDKALPDVILMDLSIPGVDGWEVTRRLKADPRTGEYRPG